MNPSNIAERNGSDGRVHYYQAFVLEDLGDFACQQPNFWVDIYFGRYKPSNAPCACNNGTEYCTNDTLGSPNNCTDAINWGNQPFTYNGP